MYAGIYWYIQPRKESTVVGAVQGALGAKKSLDLIWRFQKLARESSIPIKDLKDEQKLVKEKDHLVHYY